MFPQGQGQLNRSFCRLVHSGGGGGEEVGVVVMWAVLGATGLADQTKPIE